MDDKLNEIAFLDDIVHKLSLITKRINELNETVVIRCGKAVQEVKDFETRQKISKIINTKTQKEAEKKGYERESYLR
tara:strand:- start:2429 stop:2659 length:231 start_codon:yes stop_codon:yes gene_type:complete